MTLVKIVIPARMESSRLEGKPLLMAGGKALVHWTYDKALGVTNQVEVVTPDKSVFEYCQDNDLSCTLNVEEAPCGTSRIADLFKDEPINAQWVVNWQVDEPLVPLASICAMLNLTWGHVRTLVKTISEKESDDRNCVKAVMSGTKCLWFSRYPISRIGHCGVYSMSVQALRWFGDQGNVLSAGAVCESLEQLQWLEGGVYEMHAAELTTALPLSINTEDDWNKFKEMVEYEDG